MRLSSLVTAAELRLSDRVGGDPEVVAIEHRSTLVVPGALFCCVRGQRVDGHDFAQDAIGAGAVALAVERRLPFDTAQIVVNDTRIAMAPLASAIHGHPSRAMTMVGVTGTNGKTTTVSFLASIFAANGWSGATIGTLTGPRTTPEAPELQALLARFRDEGANAVAMEVTSHGLAQHRVDAITFAVGVFTNLSRDHLDYHGTMEAYFAAKASLFEPGRAGHAVVNLDDPHGRLLADTLGVPVTGFSLSHLSELRVGATHSTFRWHGVDVEIALGGRFNVTNALAAATAASVLGIEPHVVANGLRAAAQVPGRFESVDAGQPFPLIVDYAHTPDGLEQVLRAARDVAVGGRVLVVFGCGGERDATKRPAMGQAAAELADVAVITSDNPRSEDPDAIIAAVRSGIVSPSRARVLIEPDRRRAIGLAIAEARDGDVVVVAGKGHETTQTIGDQVRAFDDRVVARELLEDRSR
ncbi:MAG: UDP-N-acetylmuramoyl-L-alanyl-D-glutamate--2,6-diaminopimelate ligase [Acidimicrobiales bacterium]